MKRHVQEFGVKPWAGQDLLDLQAEPFKAIDAFFAEYGNCIIKGCEVTPAGNLFNVTPGLVALAGTDNENTATFKVVPFTGAEAVTLPLYLTLTHTVVTRPYADKKVRPIAYDYKATASTVQPTDTPFFEITTTGGSRFVDAIKITGKLDKTGNGRDVTVTFAEAAERVDITSGEKLSGLFGKIAKWLASLKTVAFTGKAADLEQDTTHRLVSDTEKATWADKYTKANTYTRTEIEQKIAAIVDSAPGTLDTLKELATALGNDPNFATSIMALIGGKADTVHAHTIANIAGLQNELNGKVDNVGRLKISKGEEHSAGLTNGIAYAVTDGGEHVFATKNRGFAFETTPEGGKLNKNNIWHAGNLNPANFYPATGGEVKGIDSIEMTFLAIGGHSRGIYFKEPSTGAINGAVGSVAINGKIDNLYMTVGETPWSGRGLLVRKDRIMFNNKPIVTTDQLDAKADKNHAHAGLMKIIIAGHVSQEGKRMDDSVGPIFQASLDGGVYTVIHSRGNPYYHVTLTGGKGNGRGGHVYASLIEKEIAYFKVKTADDDSPNSGDFYFTMYEIV